MSMKHIFSARLLAFSAVACLAATFTVSAPAQVLHHTKKPKKASSTDPLAGVTSKQPDKELFDKAMTALKKGKYDVARLDLQANEKASSAANVSKALLLEPKDTAAQGMRQALQAHGQSLP